MTTGGGVLSHPVGLAVHDDGPYRPGPLRPGHVFSVDPQLWVPEENLYYRYEDVVVITETGYLNFTDFLPTELDAIEKTVRTGGLLQKVPPPAPALSEDYSLRAGSGRGRGLRGRRSGRLAAW